MVLLKTGKARRRVIKGVEEKPDETTDKEKGHG